MINNEKRCNPNPGWYVTIILYLTWFIFPANHAIAAESLSLIKNAPPAIADNIALQQAQVSSSANNIDIAKTLNKELSNYQAEFRIGIAPNDQLSLNMGGGQDIITQIGIIVGKRESELFENGDTGKRLPVSFGVDFALYVPISEENIDKSELSLDAKTSRSQLYFSSGLGLWFIGNGIEKFNPDGSFSHIESYFTPRISYQANLLYRFANNIKLIAGYHTVRGVEIGFGFEF